MKPHPEVIELDYDELESKLDQIEAVMGPQMVQPFRQLLHWYTVLLGLLRDKTISIQRLQRMLFGASTERTSKVLPSPSSSSSDPPTDTEPLADQATASGNDSAASSSDPQSNNPAARPRRPGHGRHPAEAYTGCPKVIVTHESLRPGDSCPHCVQGTIYRQCDWSPVVRLKGQPPVGGTVYQLERLRCHLCGCILTAELPEEAGPEKYDPTVASIIATLRYGEGVPWNRIQRVQQAGGIPLSASTQWEVVRDAIDRGPQAAYDHLLWLAAQGDLVHNDDTTMRVLELMDRIKHQQPLLEEAPDRRGVFTTGILSLADGRPTIALFFTGPYHSGENLRAFLANRQDALPPPIQMCDGLSRNMPEDLQVILANCLTHGRRYFVDVAAAFPSEVEYVLECLEKIYKTDAQAKKQQLSPDERLRLHQEDSRPVMDELHGWLTRQFDEKRVEPNSSLGRAISYMLRHWDKLTLFLRVPGAPLDNNLCEQAMKMAIRHRRNSLFYKTLRGAKVGDLYMTLIHTCYFSTADPFDYLTQLQRNQERVKAAPGDWMPWNYREQLVSAEPHPHSSGGLPASARLPTAHPPAR
jgi:hypothetical protein